MVFFRSIFCPGVRSPFPVTRLMLFYLRDFGTAIINDLGSELAMKEYREALSLGIKNKNVKNDEAWEFYLLYDAGNVNYI